jgi:hypothetical protein
VFQKGSLHIVHLAVKIHDETREGQTKTLTVHQLHSIMAASNLAALAEFWRALQRLAEPNAEISLHAESVLREMAEFSFRNCDGVALSRPSLKQSSGISASPRFGLRRQGNMRARSRWFRPITSSGAYGVSCPRHAGSSCWVNGKIAETGPKGYSCTCGDEVWAK